jgi:hypothetical protein
MLVLSLGKLSGTLAIALHMTCICTRSSHGIGSAVVVAMLVATSGIIVSYQIAFGIAGGTSPGTSNVGGNDMPAQQPLK